jgi:hypothetical protein
MSWSHMMLMAGSQFLILVNHLVLNSHGRRIAMIWCDVLGTGISCECKSWPLQAVAKSKIS